MEGGFWEVGAMWCVLGVAGVGLCAGGRWSWGEKGGTADTKYIAHL